MIAAKALGVVAIHASKMSITSCSAADFVLYAPPLSIAGTAITTDLLAIATTPVGVLIASLYSILIKSYFTLFNTTPVAFSFVFTLPNYNTIKNS